MNGVGSILHPKRVAIVGASDQVDKIGGRPIYFLRRDGFDGDIIPINPNRTDVQGLPTYPTVASVEGEIDVAILAVPAEIVEDTVDQCGKAGVRTAIVFASGFAEVGADGRKRQDALAARAKSHRMRLVGPNSIGVTNFACGATLCFASGLLDTPPQDGPIAIISQSGAFGIAAYAQLRELGLGVRYMCATGNQADLSVADFLRAIADDAAIRVALLYVEHGKDLDELGAAVRHATSAGLGVLTVSAGMSPHGARAALLHTGGSLAERASPAFFESHGAIPAEDLRDLVEKAVSSLAARHKMVAAPRLALISNSGASCVIAADAAAEMDLDLATLSIQSQARLGACLPAFSLNRNPIDLTAMLLARPQLVAQVLDIVLADPGVDAASLGLLAVAGPGYDIGAFAAACVAASATYAKPVVAYGPSPRVRAAFRQVGVATFESERQALGYLRINARLSRVSA